MMSSLVVRRVRVPESFQSHCGRLGLTLGALSGGGRFRSRSHSSISDTSPFLTLPADTVGDNLWGNRGVVPQNSLLR
jgi:hypothetical protein